MEWESLLAHFLAYEMADIIRIVSLVIAFLLLGVFADRATWSITDTIATLALGGTLLVAPGVFLGFMVKGTLSPAHLLLARLSAIAFIGCILLRYLTRESRDGTVHITVLMSKVFMWSTIIMCQVYSHFFTTRGKKTVEWNDEFVKLGIFGSIMMLLGNLVHLLRSNDFMTYPQCNIRLNTHLRIDAWLMTLAGVAMIAFPDVFTTKLLGIKTANCVHLHLVRCIGAVYLGEAFCSVQAPGFLHERDKRAQLLGRFMTPLLMMIPCLWACFGPDPSINTTHLLLIAASLAPSMLNSLLGYVLDGTTIYAVPERGEKNSLSGNEEDDCSYLKKYD